MRIEVNKYGLTIDAGDFAYINFSVLALTCVTAAICGILLVRKFRNR